MPHLPEDTSSHLVAAYYFAIITALAYDKVLLSPALQSVLSELEFPNLNCTINRSEREVS